MPVQKLDFRPLTDAGRPQVVAALLVARVLLEGQDAMVEKLKRHAATISKLVNKQQREAFDAAIAAQEAARDQNAEMVRALAEALEPNDVYCRKPVGGEKTCMRLFEHTGACL